MLRHMGPALWRVGLLSLKLGRAVSPGTALALFEDDTSHCHGCNSFYIKLEWIQTISQLSPQFHPPYCSRDHRFDLRFSWQTLGGEILSCFSPWFLVTQLFSREYCSCPPSIPRWFPHALPIVLFSLHVWAWERNAEPAEGSGRQMENDY